MQEHFGFKVSTLNIAQVKRKYGIIERECYNKGKDRGCKNSRGVRKKRQRRLWRR